MYRLCTIFGSCHRVVIHGRIELRHKNGYTLTYSSLSGSGTINETTGIEAVKSQTNKSTPIYNLAGQRVSSSAKGIVIKDGKKMVMR